MAACRANASRISNRSAGDAVCEGGIVGDDGEDGPQGCVWACPSAADGMVPAGARQIDWIAGDAGAAGCAQAASRKVAGRRIEHSGNNAVLETQTLGDGRRQAARFKAGEGRLGSQDRSILARKWICGTTYRLAEAKAIG